MTKNLNKITITNGDYFNNYWFEKTNEICIPFRESMMSGNTVDDVFSKDFITVRCDYHKISQAKYLNNLKDVISLRSKINEIEEIKLFFGEDTFCQINLLTFLAYLEQINFSGKVVLNLIDDYSMQLIKRDIPVKLGIYKGVYKSVLIDKILPSTIEVLNNFSLNLYFDYLSSDGKLAKIVKQSPSKSDYELLVELLEQSKEYGLSDVQAKELIEKHRGQTL
jgi:hypothetical protein